jgi:DNA-binding transcriptional ArsR family regulator
MSAQLLILANAGLIAARRDGRSIIYAADFERMGELLQFLTKDCCGGRPEICAPLAQTVNAPPKKRVRHDL